MSVDKESSHLHIHNLSLEEVRILEDKQEAIIYFFILKRDRPARLDRHKSAPIGYVDDMIKCPRPMCPRTKSLGFSVPWTMRPLDDAAIEGRGP